MKLEALVALARLLERESTNDKGAAEGAEGSGGAAARERPALLGIVGPPGSGKSTLTEALHGAMPDWSLVQMDGFHLSNEALLALGRRERKGAPDTFDVAGFIVLLHRIRALPLSGRAGPSGLSDVVRAPRFHREFEPVAADISDHRRIVYAPRFHREIEEPVAGSLAVLPQSPGVFVEGNYLLHDEHGWSAVAPLLDAVWYVDTPIAACRQRLVDRATKTYGPVQGPAWVDNVDEPNAKLVRAGATRADRRVQLEL